eukprot:TRINITY_DN5332_c0_g1_i3.p1 TRINITY_DN5332_c0_g1~~TRINITY_DN5332_c0_g1_i3.p1  ORF type:complete len:183 (-),score=35.69 TRINITY_DN5332_c0_g1_i3:616-1164(-)
MGGKNTKKKDASGGAKWKREMKVVVLGIAASGKSTFTRQMRLLHQAAWTQQELDSYYAIICANIYDGMKEVCATLKAQDMECALQENAKRARYYRELGTQQPQLDATEAKRLNALWQDDTVKSLVKTMSATCDVHMFNLNFFMSRLDYIAADNYVPSDLDILHSRQRSTGATETSFVVCTCG